MIGDRLTARWRLTLLLNGLLLFGSVAVVVITYALVAYPTGELSVYDKPGVVSSPPPGDSVRILAQRQSDAVLHRLLTGSTIAVVTVFAVSLALSWLTAGRVLRPLRRITESARRITATNLHERLAIDGPDDEVRDLGDTFDAMLDRLDRAFDGQRTFVAHASHELRTPLALQRATIEVALADRGLDLAAARQVLADLLETQEQQERLIGALLTLAQSERPLDHRVPVDLAGLARDALATPAAAEVRQTARLAPATVVGDEKLLEVLVANLVGNAVVHNVPGGWLEVTTGVVDGHAMVRVTNSGPVIPADHVERLLLPFQRLRTRRGAQGHGLGLALVASIATTHDGVLSLTARPDGGLSATVTF